MSDSKKKTPTLSIEFVLVDPALAKRWLSLSKGNRPINARTVRNYVRAFSSGQWHARNGEALKFHTDGSLGDGHHRLHAIIDFGAAVLMGVIRGVDGPCDLGLTRTPGHQAQFLGIPNANAVMAVCASLLDLIRPAEKPIPSERFQMYAAVSEVVQRVVGYTTLRSMGSPAMAAFVYAAQADPKVWDFAAVMDKREALGRTGATLLRSVELSKNRSRRLKMTVCGDSRRETTLITLRCISAWIAGEDLHVARPHEVNFGEWQRRRKRAGVEMLPLETELRS